MAFDAPTSRPAITVHDDGQTRAIIIDGSQEAGRRALAAWSYIDPVRRAKWATPYRFRTMEEIDAEWAAAERSVAV